MAEPTLITDPRIYGGPAVPDTPVPEFVPRGPADPGTAPPYSAPEGVQQDQLGKDTMSAAVGQQQIEQNARPIATAGESVRAAAKTWTTTRAFESLTVPDFAVDFEFDPKPYINHAPMMLSTDEHRFLARSRSEAEYEYRLNAVTDQRKLYQQMGDHPILSTIVGMADPVYFGIDLASLGVGRAFSAVGAGIKAQRLATFASAAGATYEVGKMTQDVAPVSDNEVIFNALVNGAAGAAFYRAGKFVPRDPAWPSDELAQAVNKLKGTEMGVEKRIVNEVQDVADTPLMTNNPRGLSMLKEQGVLPDHQVGDAYSYLSKHVNDTTYGPMVRTLMDEQGELLGKLPVFESELAGKRSFYNSGTHTMHMHAADTESPFIAVHEAVHGLTVHKLQYGIENPGSAHGRIASQLENIRQDVLEYIKRTGVTDSNTKYFARDPYEFVAGLYSGNNEFAQTLARMPAQGSTNTLARMVNVVRKLLGIPPSQENALTSAIGLSNDLMKLKLDVKMRNTGDILNFAPPSGTAQQMMQTVIQRQETLAEKTGNKLSWSLHKTMSNLGTEGKRIADALVDDPVNMRGDSVVSQRVAIRNDLYAHQYTYEDLLKNTMAEQGAGLFQRLTQPRKAAEVQARVERQVYAELLRRENAVRNGLPHHDPSVAEHITKLADAHDAATKSALRELKAAGATGADAVQEMAGYMPRRWSITAIEGIEEKLMAGGLTQKAARQQVKDMVAQGIASANPTMAAQTTQDVAAAIIERARRKGYFEDSAIARGTGTDGTVELRNILEQANLPAARVQAAVDAITGAVDEAGKQGALKHRIAIDTTASSTLPDGQRMSIIDLLDTNVSRNLENYLDASAGNAALSRKGLGTPTAIQQLRSEYLHGIETEAGRKEAANLFDQTINSLRGLPTGEALSDGMRKLQAATQMVGLASSGLWQMTEYANAMAKYGMVKTTKEILRNMPVFRTLLGEMEHNVDTATSLHNILTRNSSQDMRLRPFVQKMEDGFEMPMSDAMLLSATQAKQLVPYINAMKFIHHHQAETVANLIVDTLQRAVKGEPKAVEALGKYGLDAHHLGSVRSDILANGMDTARWSDATWAQVRGPLGKMMDDSVLKNRTGEIPAFAQFSSLGKFIFTFRSFVLGAHNKVLAGTIGREGFGGLGLLMLYQFPMTIAASQANSVMRGKPETDINKLSLQALAQMGSMGMFGELWGVVSGEKQQFGASGLIALDRLYKTGASAFQGRWGAAGSSAINSIPLLSIIPGVKAMAETLKSDPKHKKE
ncbi:internal virion protein with endolysin domain [Ralstonia phage phiAp1]|uniref:Internal virion protein n=1 Tax=Ralstonia phage phiAp1 TaxID=2783867 RepID=A0A1L7DS62_9CAUD|nr:internal virion protein with endolysin domain [Ralstonia phage phiAp1]APU03187.1 internal virion protein [Ralstonia phage phiAp1]